MSNNKDGERRLKLDLVHSFGSSTCRGFRDCVGIYEEDGNKKIIYPVGKFIAIKNIEKPDMSFVKLNDNLDKIICMAISPNKKSVAMCESYSNEEESKKKCPTVTVYNIR